MSEGHILVIFEAIYALVRTINVLKTTMDWLQAATQQVSGLLLLLRFVEYIVLEPESLDA